MRSKQSAVVVPSVVAPPVAPLLIDLKRASAQLGIAPFALRNLLWHDNTRRLLKPVRQGLKYLFSPAVLTEFAAKLVAGEVEFPRTPETPTTRRRAVAKRRAA
jgi:hypothetical protein